MKSTQRRVSAKESCSCTSCIYRSDSDHPSIRQMIKRGTKVDRLYYGRYLPLRERNLLGKLVRTRGEYDDIRRLLLSGSSSSDISKADLKPRKKSQVTKKETNDLENSSLSVLVNMVDKGVSLAPHTLSNCCSCCSCSSKIRIIDDTSNLHRNVHKHPPPPADYIASRTRTVQRQAGRNSRNVRFKTKHIRSDPCTCTFKFSGLMKKYQSKSKFMKRQYQPQPVLEKFQATTERRRHRVGNQESILKSSFEKMKGSKARLLENMEANIRASLNKLHESQTKLNEKFKASAKSSKETLKTAANRSKKAFKVAAIKSKQTVRNTSKKSKEVLKTATKKSLDNVRQAKNKLKNQLNTKGPAEVATEGTYVGLNTDVINDKIENFKIRKDSITKYREELERKREMKDWECQFDCYPDQCVPDVCYEKLKLQRKHRESKEKRGERQNLYKYNKDYVTEKKQSKNRAKKHKKTSSLNKESPHSKFNLNVIEKQPSKVKRRKSVKGRSRVYKKDDSELLLNKELRRISRSLTNLEEKVDKQMAHQKNFHRTLSSYSVNKQTLGKVNKTEMQRLSTIPVNELKNLPKKVRLDKKESYRQAVRLGSSFDFNIEFYKTNIRDDNNYNIINNRSNSDSVHSFKNESSKRRGSVGKIRNAPKVRNKGKNKSIEAKPLLKDSQVGSHALKRCFCTLKLKSKTTKSIINKKSNLSTLKKKLSISQGVQTTGSQLKITSQKLYNLKPYECEPLVCVTGECDPTECEKLVKKRNIKHRSILTTTNQLITKSSSAVNKPVPISSSRDEENPPHEQETKLFQEPPTTKLQSKPNKQIVRIGSSFDFNIEFYKEYPSRVLSNKIKTGSEIVQFKRNRKSSNGFIVSKAPDKKTRRIKHKLSQISSSTAKSKNTKNKRTFPRCFCSLKLGKSDKYKSKIKKLSKGTLTSLQDKLSEEKPARKSISVMTKKLSAQYMNPKLLLPYEYEPRVCVARECNPYECIDLIKQRNIKHSKKANTPNRLTKSISSFTSISNSSTKKNQSSAFAYKNKMPQQKIIEKEMDHYRSSTSPHYPNRKAVKIGSSFNLSIEFYKEKRPTATLNEIKNHHPSRISYFSKGDQHSYAIKKIKERNELIRRKGKNKSKRMSVSPTMLRSTPGVEHKHANIDTASAGTRTDEKYLSQIQPYECEPFICVPGECNPYHCIERIKKRHVKQIGVATTPSKLKSTSSITPNSISKSKYKKKLVQSKSLAKKRKLSKNTAPTIYDATASLSNPVNHSRQVMRIGSNCSFEFEIFKKQFPARRKSMSLDDIKPKLLKSKETKSFNRPVSQDQTQTNKVKTVQRASQVRKILKRCFCALQLKNKNKSKPIIAFQRLKQPTKLYTVSMVTVDNTHFLNRNIKVLKNVNIFKDNVPSNCPTYQNKSINNFDQAPYTIHSLRDFEIQNTKSNLIAKKEPAINEALLKCNTHNKDMEQYLDYLLNSSTNTTCTYYSDRMTDVTGASRYLKKCYCTMNIQIANEGKFKSKRKLERYECEPGVCIPYECDPLECEKRIMHRLIKQASTMSGITTSSRSSYTSREASAKTKKLQSNAINKKKTKNRKKNVPGINYEMHAKSHRQAVRVGSCFKFDIEFSKDRSGQSKPAGLNSNADYPTRPFEKRLLDSRNMKQRETKSTEGHKVRHSDRDTQSFMHKMESKASSVTPLLKRCFCTLKLHEKAREKRTPKEQVNQGTLTSCKKQILPKTIKITQSQGTLTPQFRKLKRNLESYECEPGVCIPGECNPYECLEFIKKRNKQYKDFGTNSMKQKRMSSMKSMTAKPKHGKSIQIQSNLEDQTRQQKASGKKPKGPKANVKTNNKQKPSRQAVRIGSTFSFNVEFYKEKTQPLIKARDAYFQKPQGEIRFSVKPKSYQKSCQDEKKCSNTSSQMNLVQPGKSTMTKSYLERCFCTAKLYENGKKAKLNKDLESEKRHPNRYNKSITKSISTAAQTKAIKIKRQKVIRTLEPYECEPGVCVPGQCDVYECEKIIKKRNEIGTLTRINPGTSTSSMTSSLKSKDVNSQYRSRAERSPYRGDTTLPKSIVIKPHTKLGKQPINSTRQAVRIGSSLNFDLEFFKDKSRCDNCNPQKIQREKTKKPIKTSTSTIHKIGNSKNKKTQGQKVTRNYESQVFSKKMRSAVTQMSQLKRCFCTLTLRKGRNKPPSKATAVSQNNLNYQAVMVDKGTKTPKYKNNNIPALTLEPFECEPGVCIPGECDPYECDKIIQKRNKNMRSQRTETKNLKATSTYASDSTTSKVRKIQTKSDSHPHTTKKTPKPKELSSAKTDRNAVRIGSSFSFDIEFFKERSRQPVSNQSYRGKDKHGKKTTQSTKSSYQGVRFHHRPSQNPGPERMSKSSGVGPILKRCFCTLKLQKNGKQQKNPDVKNIKNGNCLEDCEMKSQCERYRRTRLNNYKNFQPVKLVYNATTITHNNIFKLDSYDCKSGPYNRERGTFFCSNECDKRMKQYLMRNLVTTNKLPPDVTTSSSIKKYLLKTKSTKGESKKERSRKYKNIKVKQNEKFKKNNVNKTVRQIIRIGSVANFNINTFQQSPLSAITKPSIVKKHHHLSKFVMNGEKRKLKNFGTSNGTVCSRNQNVETQLKLESRKDGIKTFIKRCFCRFLLNRRTPISLNIRHISNTAQRKRLSRKHKLSQSQSVQRRGCEKRHRKKIPPSIIQLQFPDIKNGRTVPVGSNYSREIDFFKESLPSKISRKKNINKINVLNASGIQISNAEKESGLVTENLFLSCHKDKFKNISPKKRRKNNSSVARVEMDQNKNLLPFHRPEFFVYYQISNPSFYRTKKRVPTKKPSCTAIHEQRSKKHKINKTQFVCKNKTPHDQCTCNPDCSLKIKKSNKKNCVDNMETILPYRPGKFKKNSSKTCISYNAKQNDNCSCCSSCTSEIPRKSKLLPLVNAMLKKQKKECDRGTEKQSVVEETKKSLLKRIIRKFKEMLAKNVSEPKKIEEPLENRQTENKIKTNRNDIQRRDILKYSKSERYPESATKQKQDPKKSKSLKMPKVTNANNKSHCPCEEVVKQKYRKTQIEDVNNKFNLKLFLDPNNKKVKYSPGETKELDNPANNPVCCKPLKQHGIKVAIKAKSSKLQHNKLVVAGKYFIDKSPPITPGTTSKSSDIQIPSHGKGDEKFNKRCFIKKSKDVQNGKLKIQSKGKGDKNIKNQILRKNVPEILASNKKEANKKNKKYIADQNTMNTETSLVDNTKINKKLVTVQNTADLQTSSQRKGGKYIKKHTANQNIPDLQASSKIKGSKINKKQIRHAKENIKKSSTKSIKQQNENCECVPISSKNCDISSCLSIIRRSFNIFKQPKLISNDICSCAIIYKQTRAKERILAQRKKIAERHKKVLKEKQKILVQKRKKVTEKRKTALKKKRAKQSTERKKAKSRKKVQDKINDKAYQKRLKVYRKEDKLIAKARRKSDQMALKGYETRPDFLLCAESVCDVAKCGGRTVNTVGRTFFRFIKDPRYASYRLKQSWRFLKTNPREGLKLIVKFPFTGLSSTLQRVKRRIFAMNVTKKVKNKMMQYGVTSVMLDAAQGKRSKLKRKKARRKKKEREPLDFQCNLYMASLRKRPYLKIYYMCPGFYPHFVSIFLALKQFLQMLMLLLAVIVWCPCILCIELCRAFLCCCVCTQ